MTGVTRAGLLRPPSEGRSVRRGARVLELLIVVQAMARLMCDVDMAEQAEIWRLEGGGSPIQQLLRSPTAWPSCMWSDVGADAESEESTDAVPHVMPQAVSALSDARAAAAAQLVHAAVNLPGSVAPTPSAPPAPSAAPLRNSTVEAARRRVRGPTLTEQRLRAAEDAEKAERKRIEQLEQRKAAKGKAVLPSDSEGGGNEDGGSEGGVARKSAVQNTTVQPSQQRGRARLNEPLGSGNGAVTGSEFARRSKAKNGAPGGGPGLRGPKACATGARASKKSETQPHATRCTADP